MFKSSITRFIIASLAVLIAALLVATLIMAGRAWSSYALAERIAGVTATDQIIFNALVSVRAQVPRDSMALVSEDDPRSVIRLTYGEASRAVQGALAALRASGIADGARLAAVVEQTWREVLAQQAEVDRQAGLPRARRSLLAVDGWRAAIQKMMDALGSASIAVGNEVRIADARIAEYVQVRQVAWRIRDRYGLQCALLRATVDAGTPPSQSTRDAWISDRAIYLADWRFLDDFLSRPGASSDLLRLAAEAHANTSRAQATIDAVVDHIGAAGGPAMGSLEWTALCDGPFDSILAIARQSQLEATRRAADIRSASFRMLLVAALDLTAVIAFGAFAVVVVRRRFTRPMGMLTETIARLSRREYAQPVPAPRRPDELGSMALALEALRASSLQAAQLQTAMSRFTADASHQLRTPLTVLQAHISVLDGLLPGSHDARAALTDIRGAADRLQRLLIQLLGLATADAGHASDPDATCSDLRELVQDICGEYLKAATEAGVDLHFEADTRALSCRANPIMIREILANLIDNAIRYNAPGGHVVVRMLQVPDALVIEVEDDGPGIPPAERAKVVTRFYRLKRDQSQVGSGLGLAIVESLAASCNAKFELGDGAHGRGLLARLRLPIAPRGSGRR
ncbi:MAG TPA: HAMP domain-containing sensor histidine kinase [Candidatus Dormibacteraeota bacterium]|nr:HAMP domain-containing sensor histidine kinase [Candidatus Dormibacteraeota bacterium]